MSRVMTVSTPGPRRPGRPRATEPGSSVSTWVPTRDHDCLVRLANLGGVSVSTLVKQIIQTTTRPPR